MGTNYYIIKNVSPSEKEEMIKAIQNDDFGTVVKMMPEKIHIGKYSSGWRFCFDHNNWEYFDKNIQSLKDFILQHQIANEYGETITHNDFWDMVESAQDKQSHEFWQGQRVGFVLDEYDFADYTGFS